MPEKPDGVLEAPNAEEIKKQRAAELEREIQQKKEYIAVMEGHKEEWQACKRYVDTLQRQLSNNEFDPVTEKRKREELTKYQEKLEKIEGECCEKYKIQNVRTLSSVINDYGMEIGRSEEKLQILQGRPYVFGQRAGQSQQGQDDNRQQRVKVVAEPQAEFAVGKGKNNETPESPGERVQNQYTALTVTTFQSHREMLKREHQENKSKAHDEIEQDRPKGREM